MTVHCGWLIVLIVANSATIALGITCLCAAGGGLVFVRNVLLSVLVLVTVLVLLLMVLGLLVALGGAIGVVEVGS